MDQELAWPLNDFGRPDAEQRPNFRAARDMALGFLSGVKDLKATRDVRPMLTLVIAEAGDKGPVGLAKALDLFVATATTHWDAIHPQKEDEDDDELMTRMEEMRKYMNPSIFSLAVESVGIARSPRVGDLTTRTFGIAATKVTPRTGEFAPNSDALVALLAEEEEARVSVIEAHDAYHYAIDRLKVMEAFLAERPDVDPVDLAGVAAALEKQVAFLAPYVGGAAEISADAVEGSDAPDQIASPQAASPSAPISGPKTLDEAMGLLDDVLRYYAQNARSSPVPLGLIALRDLMAGDFNTWINQTASSGLAEAAISLASVDASRLSSFASGGAPAAVAPVAVEFDFTDIDASIYEAETAFAVIDNAVYQHQLTLPPDEGAETNSVLAAEVVQMREALDKIQAAKLAMATPTVSAADETGVVDNAPEGDPRHSRITDRNGVKQSLDAVAAYFEREEPSSPAPGYLRRLRSLVDARFSEIARELMPEDGGEAKLRLEPRTNLR
jgi:predicted component of type VI protein secretion system